MCVCVCVGGAAGRQEGEGGGVIFPTYPVGFPLPLLTKKRLKAVTLIFCSIQ